jgi:alkylated DNA repair dioxygenase AlkB
LLARYAPFATLAAVAAAQLSLFDAPGVALDTTFHGALRTELPAATDEAAWVEYVPAWLSGHQVLFEELRRSVRWRQEERQMYERRVQVPRLYATLPADGPLPDILQRAARLLSERYGEAFERISLGYYRDGQDSVAWHGDYVARTMRRALVATISLGAPRPFLLRPSAGGRSLVWSLGWGDLIVMGGSCQRSWQHCVPKRRQAAPRISVMFRPAWPEEAVGFNGPSPNPVGAR